MQVGETPPAKSRHGTVGLMAESTASSSRRSVFDPKIPSNFDMIM